MKRKLFVGIASSVAVSFSFLATDFACGFLDPMYGFGTLLLQVFVFRLLLSIAVAERCSVGFKYRHSLATGFVLLTFLSDAMIGSLGLLPIQAFLRGVRLRLPPETVLKTVAQRVAALQSTPDPEAGKAELDKIILPTLKASLNGEGRRWASGLSGSGDYLKYRVVWIGAGDLDLIFTSTDSDLTKYGNGYLKVQQNVWLEFNASR